MGLHQSAAQSPQASGQYGGYGSPQAPMPSPQGGYACQPQKYACDVTVCPNPCQMGWAGQDINNRIPPIQPPPTCHEANAITVINEGPPPVPPYVFPIYRNCYVPIRVVTQPGPSNVTPVNFQVNWREVHVLCDSQGVPYPPAKASAILKELTESLAKASKDGATEAAPPVPTVTPTAAPAAPAPPVQASAPAPATPAPTQAQATATPKQWVWLAQEGVYGFGYLRTDGLWEIDPDSRRPTLQN